ncbi:MAG: hypothetical protein ACRECQ_01375, partial [Burkholderiaceae bacterium]
YRRIDATTTTATDTARVGIRIEGVRAKLSDQTDSLRHPLRTLPSVVLTPHIGFVSQPVFEAFARGVTECLLAWLRNQPPVRSLNAD